MIPLNLKVFLQAVGINISLLLRCNNTATGHRAPRRLHSMIITVFDITILG
jgi:hypothetical protein